MRIKLRRRTEAWGRRDGMPGSARARRLARGAPGLALMLMAALATGHLAAQAPAAAQTPAAAQAPAAGPVTDQGRDPPRADQAGDPPLAAFSYGKGTPVVIVPGVLGSTYGFRKVIPALTAADFRVVVIDPLGFGSSPRPDHADYSATAQAERLARAIEQHAGTHVILVCHALAGPICLRLAYHRPDLVRGIVSINGGVSEQAGTAQMRFALKFARLVLLVTGRGYAIRKLKDGLIGSSGDPGWVTDDVVAHYVAPFGSDVRQVIGSMEQIVGAREPEPLQLNLRRVTVPVLLLYGPVTRDPKNPALGAPEREVMRREVPHFQEEDVAGAGTYIQEEQPARVTAAVEQMRRETQ